MSFGFKLLPLILTVFTSRMTCLSLEDIHSSSQTFKSIPLNDYNSKTLGNALDSVRRRRQEYPFAHIYDSYSLPLQDSEYYKRLVPFVKKQAEEVIDVPLGFSEKDINYMEEPSTNDLFSTALALKLSQIFDKKEEKESNKDLRGFKGINMKRKRSTSKHNNYRLNTIDKNKDFNVVKQHVEDLIKHRSGLSKTKFKRKSTRRVLKNHFKIEENNAINKNNKETDLKHSIKSNSSVIYPQSYSSSKTLNSSKMGHKNGKMRANKKSITKRKVSTPLIIDKNLPHNESKIKTNGPKITDKKVISELNNILSDDNKKDKLETKTVVDKNNVKNVYNDSQSRQTHENERKVNLIKRKSKRSNRINDLIDGDIDNNENELIIPNDHSLEEEKVDSDVQNEWPTNKEEIDEWLRREYYQNIAKTLATMRRKRSEAIDILTDDYGSDGNDGNNVVNPIEDSNGENLIAIDDTVENIDNEPIINDLSNSEKFLNENDDDYVIATQDDEDLSDKDFNNDESIIWSDIEEKSSNHKSKRSVAPYFGQIGDNTETNEVSVGSERFMNVNNKLQSIEDTLINEALDLIRETARKGSQSDIETNKIENRLEAAYDIEDMRLSLDNLHKTVSQINQENSDNDNDQELDDEISMPDTDISRLEFEKKNDINDLEEKSNQYCNYVLETLSTDCSSVADLVPNGKVKDSFTESCNWHEICYICGEVYGLLSTDCDAGFLEANRLACDGSPSCETFARLVLSPLRQSRVFYKSNVPLNCYQNQCMRNFLFDTQSRKR